MTIKLGIKMVEGQDVSVHLLGFGAGLDSMAEMLVRETATEIALTSSNYEAAPLPTYQRTGKMKASQFAQKKGHALWEAGLGQDYSIWVRGNAKGERQAFMHVGRWRTFANIVTEKIAKMKKRAIQLMAIVKRSNFDG